MLNMDNSTAGDRTLVETDPPSFFARRPWTKRQAVEFSDLRCIAHLARRPTNDDAPTFTVRRVGSIDFERNDAICRRQELGARIGTEYHAPMMERVVDWKDQRLITRHHRETTQFLRREELQALTPSKLLEPRVQNPRHQCTLSPCRSARIAEVRSVASITRHLAGVRDTFRRSSRARALGGPAALGRGTTKGGAGRLVSLDAGTLTHLKAHRAERIAEQLRVGVPMTDTSLVFATPEGAPRDPDRVSETFIRFVRRQADMPRLRFHDMRHTHATILLRAGVPLVAVAKRLGNSVEVCGNTYSHVNAEMSLDYAERGAALINDAVVTEM
jgi:integrase